MGYDAIIIGAGLGGCAAGAELAGGGMKVIILEKMDKPDYDNFLENLSVEIVGRDMMIKGRAKFSDYSNTYELMTSDFKEIAVEEEIKQKIKEIIT